MPRRVVDTGDGTVVGSAEGAAGEDVRGGEGGACADAMEEKDLVCGRDEEDARDCQCFRIEVLNWAVGKRTWSSVAEPLAFLALS